MELNNQTVFKGKQQSPNFEYRVQLCSLLPIKKPGKVTFKYNMYVLAGTVIINFFLLMSTLHYYLFGFWNINVL